MEQHRSDATKCNFTDRYASGLKTSVHNNAIAYGFSIMMTAALALISASRDTPGIWEVLTFAGGAVLAFTIVDTMVQKHKAARAKVPRHADRWRRARGALRAGGSGLERLEGADLEGVW
jgi:threonine/homoserine/homoserine lactone efflux protein